MCVVCAVIVWSKHLDIIVCFPAVSFLYSLLGVFISFRAMNLIFLSLFVCLFFHSVIPHMCRTKWRVKTWKRSRTRKWKWKKMGKKERERKIEHQICKLKKIIKINFLFAFDWVQCACTQMWMSEWDLTNVCVHCSSSTLWSLSTMAAMKFLCDYDDLHSTIRINCCS